MTKQLIAAFLGTVGMTATAFGQNVTTPSIESEEARNRSLVQQGFDRWRDGTGSPYELLADDAQWTITGNSVAARTYLTRESFMREVIRPVNARMRNRLIPSIRQLYADGDTVIAFFDAQGTARDGMPYRNTYAWILQFRDGKIVRAHAFFDGIAFDAFWHDVAPATD